MAGAASPIWIRGPLRDEWLEQFEARRREREAKADDIVVGGVTLTLKPSVAPQVALRYYDAKRRLIAVSEEQRQARAAGGEVPETPDDLLDGPILDLLEETGRALLHPSSLAGWQQLRDPGSANPLNWEDLFGLVEYLIGKASGIPTGGPSDSSDGPQITEQTSTDESPSTEALSPG